MKRYTRSVSLALVLALLLGSSGSALAAQEDNPWDGLHIIWLGSSVTYGTKSDGYSMAHAIGDNHPESTFEIYAVGGTTLVNDAETSYINRMKAIVPEAQPDLFIVQLSTNDATIGKPYGELTDSFDPTTFDDKTIIGAMETIISYVQAVFGCPVVFYSGSYFDSEAYALMVDIMLDIQAKWGTGVVDLFHNEEMTALYGTEQHAAYMADDIHPNRLGYVEWWTPVFEEYLAEFVTSLPAPVAFAPQTVFYDGIVTQIESYLIGGQSYLKLRDVAKALIGTDLAFDVANNAQTNAVSIQTGKEYTAVGGEFIPANETNGADRTETFTSFEVDGQALSMRAYLMGGNHYCHVADLAKAIGFAAGYDWQANQLYLTSNLGTIYIPPEEMPGGNLADYTKQQIVALESLSSEIFLAMNEDESRFYLRFFAYNRDNLIFGTLQDGEPTVEYDRHGLFGGRSAFILAAVNPEAWEPIAE